MFCFSGGLDNPGGCLTDVAIIIPAPSELGISS